MMMVDSGICADFGIIFAFVLESLDTGIRSVAEIESISGLPRSRSSPASTASRGGDRRALTGAAKLSVIGATPSRSLPSLSAPSEPHCCFPLPAASPSTILLTSATPSEGKTTIAMNLACVLAQRDVRVLLIDADLRRPTVHHRFGLNGRSGLTTVLTGAFAARGRTAGRRGAQTRHPRQRAGASLPHRNARLGHDEPADREAAVMYTHIVSTPRRCSPSPTASCWRTIPMQSF